MTDAALRTILTKTPVASTAEVLTVLSAIVEALPAGDGIWAFSRLYQAVTKEVAASVAGAQFRDRGWLDHLDATFANLYFRALSQFLAGGQDTPRAWYPLFAQRTEPRAALQFAFAGMNAHINRDLPVALVATCEQAGIELARTSPEYKDYLAINPLLAGVEAKIKAEFLTGPLAVADQMLGKLDDLIANFSVSEARAGAWSQAETLWVVRKNGALRSAFVDALDGLVGFASRGLLIQL